MKIPQSLRWRADGHTLGSGGQATVVSVVDATGELPGRYALKSLSAGKPSKAYARFAREVDAMKAVDHPRVARIFDHSSPSDSFQFYVMEFIEGARPLKKLIGTTANPFQRNALRSIRFFKQLATAIAAWEDAGIVHRDLSPANVLILPDDDIKVIDFGICQIEGAETVTLVDEGVGSQNYMAPECESGAGGEAKTWSDIYSAGKLLWTAVTNVMAFSREQPAFTTKALSTVLPENPDTWHLQRIFEKTIRHKASDRLLNADAAIQFAQRVEEVISGGFPPIEVISVGQCPTCGWGQLTEMGDGWQVYHNPIPSGYGAYKCDFCGWCTVIYRRGVHERNQSRSQLE